MMGSGRIVLLAAVLAAATAAAAALWPGAQAEPGRLDVVELYTSQGCSSCPPADLLLGELAKREDLLALSLPIDYWDYIGWKDTLADPAFTARQRGYAESRQDRDVYTPQMVVNGLTHVVGSSRPAVNAALAETAETLDGRHIPVTLAQADDALIVDLPAAARPASAFVLLVFFKPAESVRITRGENKGRTLVYHNVVRRLQRLGTWTGKAERFTARLPADPGLKCAVLVQEGVPKAPGPIIGAARL